MLKDRRVLVEEELTKFRKTAAAMYLKIATYNGFGVEYEDYNDLKDLIATMTFDLEMINDLIAQGYE